MQPKVDESLVKLALRRLRAFGPLGEDFLNRFEFASMDTRKEIVRLAKHQGYNYTARKLMNW